MWHHSKLFKFLLPLFTFLLFAFEWAYNYMAVWYDNLPNETQYFKPPKMGFYMGFVYLFAVSFLVFLILGIIYLVKDPAPKVVVYLLITDLVLSAYYVWVYTVAFKNLPTPALLLFVTLALFAVSVFKLCTKAPPLQNP
jgi:hypothetical protein